MSKKLNCILLIDDNSDDNFFHERAIRKIDAADRVVVRQTGETALEYLHDNRLDTEKYPNLIFLDINMPGIDGWEFLEEYKKLDPEQQAKAIVVMLTSSDNPADIRKAKTFNVPVEFKIKPLTSDMLSEIMDKYC
jgi:CheY-like chemotaxis protein